MTTDSSLRLSRRARKLLTFVHVVAGVGLLGATASMLLLAVLAATAEEGAATALYELADLQSVVFGIPLTFAALGTGVVLGRGTRRGVIREGWTRAKLVLTIAVAINGGVGIGPAVASLLDQPAASSTQTRLVVAAGLSAAMLLCATALSIYKPRRLTLRRHPRR